MTGELLIISPELSGTVEINSGGLSGIVEIEGTLSGDISSGGSGLRPYDGPYQVVPSVKEDQVLDTLNKRMTDNLTVLKTPTYEVSGPTGGITLIIGEE